MADAKPGAASVNAAKAATLKEKAKAEQIRQLSKMQKEHNSTLLAMKKEHDGNMSAWKKEHDKSMADRQKEHDKMYADAQKQTAAAQVPLRKSPHDILRGR
jgi:hypothetical protein